MSTPEALYRNAIDLNRYSNSVARRVINSYNDIILDAVNQLRTIEDLDESFKAARLRSILAQLKESLATWAGDSTELTALELQGLAELQSEFVEEQLKKVLPRGSRNIVRTVEISPQFAQAVVTTDPTQINVVTLSDDLLAAVQGAPQTFSLTAAQGHQYHSYYLPIDDDSAVQDHHNCSLALLPSVRALAHSRCSHVSKWIDDTALHRCITHSCNHNV